MSFRATYYQRAQAGIWTLLAFLWIDITVTQLHLQLFLVFGLIIAGVIAGGGIGAGLSRMRLSRLQRNSEMRTSLATLFILVGVIFVVASVLVFFGPNAPLSILRTMFVFVAPMPAANHAVTSIMFSNWERRNRRRIFTIRWPGGFYTIPDGYSPQNRQLQGGAL